jgi:hypothetical protein
MSPSIAATESSNVLVDPAVDLKDLENHSTQQGK